MVLTAIVALGDRAYGVTIHAKVEELARPRRAALGAVYATLDRLEDKQLINSWLSAPTAERGGRSRRHYRLEPNGERALHEAAVMARRMYEIVERQSGAWGATGKKWKPARQS
jgi:DNA-binding PadR family transcriptional regulator